MDVITRVCSGLRRLFLGCVAVIAHFAALGSAQCPLQWVHDSGVPGTDGEVYSSTLWDPDGAGPAVPRLVVGGSFTRVGDLPAMSIAACEVATGVWSPLGVGFMAQNVRALAALPNGDLVAAGDLFTVGGAPIQRIARWNGVAWSGFGGGLTGSIGAQRDVEALAVLSNGDLIAAGGFTQAGGVAVNGIARWNGTAWSALPGAAAAPFGRIRALAVLTNGHLVAAGAFTRPNGAGPNIARHDGSAWFDLGVGIGLPGEQVQALQVLDSGDLIAGGQFTVAGGIAAVSLARWNGTVWSAVAGLPPGALVAACARMSNGDLVVGGEFDGNGTVGANLARWHGTTWSSFGFVSPSILTLTALASGELVAGGSFPRIGGRAATSLGRWNGSTWVAMGSGMNGTVRALTTAAGGQLVAGGDFTMAGTAPAGGIAVWNGAWSPLGSGVSRPGFSARVNALAATPNGDVIAGGDFALAGNVAANNVARWNGSAWSPLGAGTNIRVQALAVLGNGDIVAGGQFQAPYLARFDGATWSTLGGGTDQSVFALAVSPNGDLIVGGAFTSAGGTPNTRHIARWNGSAWASLGTGVDGTVWAIAVQANGDLIVGGDFGAAGGVAGTSHLARWNGSTWSSLGLLNGAVRAFARMPNGALAVGGYFTSTGTLNSTYVAIWNGSWSGGPTGTAELVWVDGVHALAALPSGLLATGGAFVVNGDPATLVAPSANFSFLAPGCAASAIVSGFGCTTAGGLLSAAQLPWVGGTYRAICGPADPTTTAVALFGFGWPNTPLQLVHPAALPGCMLHATPDVLDVVNASAGAYRTSLAIPADPRLVGMQLRHQLLQVKLGVTGQIESLFSSNGLKLTIAAW